MAFTALNNKQYNTLEEYQDRFGNWKVNHAKVEKMNESHPDVTFADNFTSDLDDSEY